MIFVPTYQVGSSLNQWAHATARGSGQQRAKLVPAVEPVCKVIFIMPYSTPPGLT